MEAIALFTWVITILLGVVFIFSLFKIAKKPSNHSHDEDAHDSKKTNEMGK